MIPVNIHTFLEKVLEKTKRDKLQWVTDEDTDTVFVSSEDFKLNIKYAFDEDREIPYFRIVYAFSGKEIVLIENFHESDFQFISDLYDIARSTQLDFPF